MRFAFVKQTIFFTLSYLYLTHCWYNPLLMVLDKKNSIDFLKSKQLAHLVLYTSKYMCQKMAKQLGLSKLQSWCTELEEKKLVSKNRVDVPSVGG